MKFNISWIIDRKGGNLDNPEWTFINQKLNELLENSGSVSISILDAPEIGPQSLQVEFGGASSMITLGEVTQDDHEVRKYTNLNASGQMVDFGGHVWDDRTLCQDPKVVYSVFKEFYTTGNVSYEVLS